MKTPLFLLALTAITLQSKSAPAPPPAPQIVRPPAPNSAPETPGAVYEQKPLASRPVLVSSEQARTIIDRFRTAYAKLGNPRVLLYVNRDLLDDQSGMKMKTRTERIERTETGYPKREVNDGGAGHGTSDEANAVPGRADTLSHRTEKTVSENSYRFRDRPAQTLSDKQTVRDVERLFGRPLRMSGVSLADQHIATQLIGDRPLDTAVLQAGGDTARRERAALLKVVDVVLEVLISSRDVVVSEITGDKTYSVPDIQATAIRLKDAKIIGQATSSDLIGKDKNAGQIARHFDVRDITEATALSLMEDMMQAVE